MPASGADTLCLSSAVHALMSGPSMPMMAIYKPRLREPVNYFCSPAERTAAYRLFLTCMEKEHVFTCCAQGGPPSGRGPPLTRPEGRNSEHYDGRTRRG